MAQRWLAAVLAVALVVAALAVPDPAHAQSPPSRETSREFNAVSVSGVSYLAIAVDDSYAYIAAYSSSIHRVHVYRLSDGARQVALEIPLTNSSPVGIAVDDTYVYVLDYGNKVYVYGKSTGIRQTDRELALAAINWPTGLAIDGTYAYIVGYLSGIPSSTIVRVYRLSDGARQADREFTLDVLNTPPQGIAVQGAYAYVVNSGSLDRVFVYQLSDGDRVTSREVALGNATYGGLAMRAGLLYVLNTNGSVYVYRIGSVPSAPTPQLEPGDDQIRVTWTPPDDGESAITGYDVQYRAGSSGTFLDAPHTGVSPAATILGLTNGTLYQVQVRAANAIGDGPWSSTASATPRSVPDPPSAPTLTPGQNGVIEVAWEAPDNGGAPITSYDVQYRSSLDWTVQTAATSTAITISSLELGRNYEVQVRANSAGGSGPWSFSSFAVPVTPGRVSSINLPLVALLRTPMSLEISYNSDPLPTDTLNVEGDATLSASPDCDVTRASYSPPPTSVPIYPCATGGSSISVNYAGDSATWTRTAQVLQPRFQYSVTVTSTSETVTAQPAVTWRSLSWPLYRDSLVGAGTVLVVEEGAGLQPLYYEEPGRDVTAIDLLVCPNGGTCTSSSSTLWSTPPSIGDEAYFASDVPAALLYITMAEEGSRETPWALDWDYSTATGWEPLPNLRDGTEGLSETGTVTWDVVDASRPMAPMVVAPLTDSKYIVRATVASAGSGIYTSPVVATAGAQAGLWSTRLRGNLEPGAATTLQVYMLPLDVVLAYHRAGPAASLVVSPPPDLETSVGPWRPWTMPVGTSQAPGGFELSLPPDIAEPIDSDGGLPLIGFAIERASTDAGVPTLLLWTIIGTAIALTVLIATQRATGNIMLSVIASGLVLVIQSIPSIGLGSVWVVLVYAFTAGSVVVIGNRLQT